jgi:hypothetical protein
MEQQLINALMKLMSKAGGGLLIKDLIRQVDEDGNPKTWTPNEIQKAIDFVTWQIENFGTSEATSIVETLLKKYNLNPETFATSDSNRVPTNGVQGLV